MGKKLVAAFLGGLIFLVCGSKAESASVSGDSSFSIRSSAEFAKLLGLSYGAFRDDPDGGAALFVGVVEKFTPDHPSPHSEVNARLTRVTHPGSGESRGDLYLAFAPEELAQVKSGGWIAVYGEFRQFWRVKRWRQPGMTPPTVKWELPEETWQRLRRMVTETPDGRLRATPELGRYFESATHEQIVEDANNLYYMADQLELQDVVWLGSGVLFEPGMMRKPSHDARSIVPMLLSHYEKRLAYDLTTTTRPTLPGPGAGCPVPGIDLVNVPVLDGSAATKPLRIAIMARLFNTGCPEWRNNPDPVGDPAQSFAPPRSGSGGVPVREFFPVPADGADRNATFAAALIRDGLLVLNHRIAEAYRNLSDRSNPCIVIDVAASPIDCDSKIIAYDALTVLVHIANPTSSLTRKELKTIVRSEASLDWKSFGDKDFFGDILVLVRNADSDILVCDLLFGGNDPAFAAAQAGAKEPPIPARSRLVDAFHYRTRALGFSLNYYERWIHPRVFVKAVAVGGVMPTHESIADHSYPLRVPIYAAIARDASSETRRIYDWLSEPGGQEVIESMGYVSARQAAP